MARTTLKAVAAALAAAGFPGYELVKGDGYFYWAGPQTERWSSTMELCNTLNQRTVGQWVAHFREAYEANRSRMEGVQNENND